MRRAVRRLTSVAPVLGGSPSDGERISSPAGCRIAIGFLAARGSQSGGAGVRPPVKRERIAVGIGDCAFLATSAMGGTMAIDAEVVKVAITGVTKTSFHGRPNGLAHRRGFQRPVELVLGCRKFFE